MGNSAATDVFGAPIAYIGSFVQAVTAFPDKVRAGLVAGRTGCTLYPAKNDLVAGISLFTTIPLLAEVLFVVERTSVEPIIKTMKADLLGYRSWIFT